MIWVEVGITVIKIALLFLVVLTLVAYLTLAERRVSAFIQDRIGPNRVGPFGLLQPLADGVKFIFKEDIIPSTQFRCLLWLRPETTMSSFIKIFLLSPKKVRQMNTQMNYTVSS